MSVLTCCLKSNAQISPAPLNYFLVLPKSFLILIPKFLKVMQVLPSSLNIFKHAPQKFSEIIVGLN